ncbi:class I tRNA ligase family protein, partial [Streptococcus pneumoniae]|uniref:class I tRNA ligase family protein n=1 Tax=Streptococcus pneumoniae TaxID=1313 RepID=UPI001249CD4B
LGWPNEEAKDYQRYYPTNVLVTGYDIIFFWVAIMKQVKYMLEKKHLLISKIGLKMKMC